MSCVYCGSVVSVVLMHHKFIPDVNCGLCNGSGETAWSSEFIGECDCFHGVGQKVLCNYCSLCGDQSINLSRKRLSLRIRAHLRYMIIKKDPKIINRLESLFLGGMSWANRGEWHIDHIKPIKKFLDEKQTDYNVINHYSNLQPLWAKDNLLKGCK